MPSAVCVVPYPAIRFGGYSGTWIARGLPDDDRLITIDVNPEHASVAEENFRLAGLAERVDIRVGDAHQLLPELSTEGPFDFIFIDEKKGYSAYLDWALENLQPGGIIAGHNVFGHGDVVDAAGTRERTEALRAFNRRLAEDPCMVSLIFPAGDGMAVAVRRRQEQCPSSPLQVKDLIYSDWISISTALTTVRRRY
jgi:predicted O-methyltransferase YrrM